MLNRREWLMGSIAGAAARELVSRRASNFAPESSESGARDLPEPAPAHGGVDEPDPALTRKFLQDLLCTRQDVDDWLAEKAFPFSRYDGELGYVHRDHDVPDGIDGSRTSYRFDASGARRMINHAGQPCRINTYGNSFSSCEQVNDGETWQEVLAARLGEPIRNFGTGGYSVYQAYLRMVREERRVPAKFVIFNVFDDDHYRNLLPWQRMRFGVNRKSINPPTPYVRVDAEAEEFAECPNPCPTPKSLYDLCDLDWVFEAFRDNFVLRTLVTRIQFRQQAANKPNRVPTSDLDDPAFTKEALFATMRILELVERFADEHGKRVLTVLSYRPENVRRRIEDGTRFDQPLVDFLRSRKLPFVDLLEAHAADFDRLHSRIDPYLARHFVGHYSPWGNFFCAFAIKDRLLELLDPPAPSYPRPVKP